MLPTMEISAMNELTASLTTDELLRLENLLKEMLSLKIGEGVLPTDD